MKKLNFKTKIYSLILGVLIFPVNGMAINLQSCISMFSEPRAEVVVAAESTKHFFADYRYSKSLFEENYHGLKEWSTTSQASLSGHIVNAHFQARTLHSFGIPRWDLEIARYRWFNVKWIVKKIYEKIERSDSDIINEITNQIINEDKKILLPNEFTPKEYRVTLVKTLRLMIDLGLISVDSVDWQRVELSLHGATQIVYVLSKDSREDGSFFIANGINPLDFYGNYRP